jgi:hypothetical protein
MSEDKRAVLVGLLMQRKFNKHREKLEAHKNKGKHFRAAVEDLEKKLFG